jgi:hypothetical protein
MKGSANLDNQIIDPISLMKSGMEDKVDMSDPKMYELNEEFKRKLYKYTVSFQEDREDVDRSLTQNSIRRLYII